MPLKKNLPCFREGDPQRQEDKHATHPAALPASVPGYRIHNRQHPAAAEAILWQALKGQQLQARKFRRQHSIENYIVDIYCASAKLIIELDGEVHEEAIARQNDLVRDERLEQLGFRILRFRNEAVTENLVLTLQTIGQFLV